MKFLFLFSTEHMDSQHNTGYVYLNSLSAKIALLQGDF